jgi:hypothetical protein
MFTCAALLHECTKLRLVVVLIAADFANEWAIAFLALGILRTWDLLLAVKLMNI